MTGTLESPTSQELTPDQLLDAYRTMKTIREFEERVHEAGDVAARSAMSSVATDQLDDVASA